MHPQRMISVRTSTIHCKQAYQFCHEVWQLHQSWPCAGRCVSSGERTEASVTWPRLRSHLRSHWPTRVWAAHLHTHYTPVSHLNKLTTLSPKATVVCVTYSCCVDKTIANFLSALMQLHHMFASVQSKYNNSPIIVP